MKKEVISLIQKGESLILDYCPWQKEPREEYRKLIEDHGGVRKLKYFSVPLDELKRRAIERNKLEHEDFQFLTPELLDYCAGIFEPPNGDSTFR
jgi:predicted kinase